MAREPTSASPRRYQRFLTGLFRVGFVLSILIVSVLLLLPGDDLPKLRLWDKFCHLVAFMEIAVLGLLGYRGGRSVLFVTVGTIALGGLLELAQHVIPGRSTDLLDFLVNGLGVLLGYGLARLLLRFWPAESTTDSAAR
jgi:VanZ family protein